MTRFPRFSLVWEVFQLLKSAPPKTSQSNENLGNLVIFNVFFGFSMKNLGNLVFFNVFSIFSMKRLGNLVLFSVLLFYSMNNLGDLDSV